MAKAYLLDNLRGGKTQKTDVKPMLLSEAIKNYRRSSKSRHRHSSKSKPGDSSHSKKSSSSSHHGRHRSGYHHRSSSSSQVSKEITEMKKQIKALNAAVEELKKKHEEKIIFEPGE